MIILIISVIYSRNKKANSAIEINNGNALGVGQFYENIVTHR